jgi:hypothetical protein
VSRFDPDATSPELEDLRVDGVACPGDIDYDSGHGRICVPDPLAGTLVFNVPNGCAEDVFKRIDYKTVQVFPEPKTNLLCVDLATGETEALCALFFNRAFGCKRRAATASMFGSEKAR